MSIENRPYGGTWRLGARDLIQHAPDALVYLNGNTSIPGCPKCNGRIDIQRFLTEVSVDAGVEPGGASASFTLSIPIHHSDSFAKDANFVIKPGLEVHVYMRGYFPVKGLYNNLAQMQTITEELGDTVSVSAGASTTQPANQRRSASSVVAPKFTRPEANLTRTEVQKWASDLGVTEDQLVAAIVAGSETSDPNQRPLVIQSLFNRQLNENFVKRQERFGGDGSLWAIATNNAPTTGRQGGRRPYSTARPPTGRALDTALDQVTSVLNQRASGDTRASVVDFLDVRTQRILNAQDPEHNKPPDVVLADRLSDGYQIVNNQVGIDPNDTVFFAKRNITSAEAKAQAQKALGSDLQELPGLDFNETAIPETVAENTPSLLDQFGLQGFDVENVVAYPYYHTFHGVVTQASHSYGSGVHTISVSCASMLHFWEYHKISTNASIFGGRPANSKLKSSLVGHNFTGYHPYQIIYHLHNDISGAAAGVQWVLSQKTNQTSTINGQSTFSLIQQYWEKRFNSRMTKLRLHGATGELFSAAQGQFLAKTSAKDLTEVLRYRFSSPSTRQKEVQKLYEEAVSLGLFNNKKLEALLVARRAAPGKNQDGSDPAHGSTPELNILEIQGFVSNLGNWGQVNLFESAYESKLDIANKVVQETGFEFYQDVDGDFVFKPPMYNLDTSSSRVYRIEDIDIINISFNEQEPQATYATVKGSHFKNLQGTGVENEWGVQAQYIDYRLVAQFGWRPLDFETAYFTDPKAMFYAAINRIDIKNAQSYTASVTIPIRPELRPGYPVYIPYLDAYYYCTSFAHSYSVGGQCTTTLQLQAKRSKFFAPGKVDPTVRGINAIDLSDTTLPERPLEVVDNSGHPRLSGFPNVVMALDPYRINPLFYVVGSTVESLDDPLVLRNLLEMAAEKRIVTKDDTTGYYSFTLPVSRSDSVQGNSDAQQVYFYFQENELDRSNQRNRNQRVTQNANVFNAVTAGREYARRRDQIRQEQATASAKIRSTQTQINQLTVQLADTSLTDAQRAQIANQIKQLRQMISTTQNQLGSLESSLTPNESTSTGVSYLAQIVRRLGEEHWVSQSGEAKGASDINAVLDLLSDKKATLSNGKQPGAYRYYSASHPLPDHQGQPTVEYRKLSSGAVDIQRRNAPVEAEYAGLLIDGFLQNQTTPYSNAYQPEAKMGRLRPVRGMRILTSNPNKPNGEVVPTSEIRELSFSVQTVTALKDVTGSSNDTVFGSFGNDLASYVGRYLPSSITDTSLSQTAKALFLESWTDIATTFVYGFGSAKILADQITPDKQLPMYKPPVFPEKLTLLPGNSVQTDAVISSYAIDGTDAYVINQVALALGQDFFRQYTTGLGTWIQSLQAAEYSVNDQESLTSAFHAHISGRLNLELKTQATSKQVRQGELKTLVESPVFPVSDERGYKVVGSYRYGRGIDIEPGGIWDSLHQQDPFQYLDKQTLTAVLDKYTRGDRGQDQPNGQLEKEVIRQLRQNLTDGQIIDLGLAQPGKDPNTLDLSLRNWFADGREGVHKVPVNNSAFSLGDLRVPSSRVCDCKVAEADVLINAFGESEFIETSNPNPNVPRGYGTGPEDRVTQLLSDTAAKNAVSWKQSQDAISGTRVSVTADSALNRFLNLINNQ